MMKLKVLVVEDDEATLEHLSALLEKEGYEVLQAATGPDGLQKIEADLPDIVVSDLRLPGCTGLDILESIRGKGNSVPVILVTAFGEVDTALRAIRLGALDYIKKPIEVDDLLVSLGRAKEVVIKNRQLDEFPALLLVEDDAASRASLARALRRDDYLVVEAVDGEQAVSLFQERKFDVVLLDLKMPRKDGLTAFEEMRGISDDFEAIILTGWGDEAAAIKALRLGAFGFSKKPIDLEELLMNIEKALRKRSADRALRFRVREISLAHQIIAQLVSNENIVVDVSRQVLENACNQAASVLNVLSDGVVILDNQQVVFANDAVKKQCKAPMVELDERLTNALADGDQRLKETLGDLLDTPAGTVKQFETASKRITMTMAIVLRDGQRERFAVIISAAKNA
jgi:DNA-binding NtrC family response regulator